MALLWFHAKVLLGFLLEVKFDEKQEDLVEDPEPVHPPGPAHPEDCEWNLEGQYEEFREEVQARLPVRHVDQLEVAQVRFAPREELGPEVRRRLDEPRVRAHPPVPNAREEIDIVPWGVLDVRLGIWYRHHDESEQRRLEPDAATENGCDELVSEELVEPDGPFKVVIGVEVIVERLDAFWLHVAFESACLLHRVPLLFTVPRQLLHHYGKVAVARIAQCVRLLEKL